jgi:uncharacterized repeat protein (TIGR01451 family)
LGVLAQTGGPTPTPDLGGTPTPGPGSALLSVNKTVQPTTAPVGTPVTFTIVVSNIGSSDAHDVVIEDMVPEPLEIVRAAVTRGNVRVTGQTVEATVGILSPGEVVTLTVVANVRPTAPPSVSIRNIVHVRYREGPELAAAAAVMPVMMNLPRSGAAADPLPWAEAGLVILLAVSLGAWRAGRRLVRR